MAPPLAAPRSNRVRKSFFEFDECFVFFIKRDIDHGKIVRHHILRLSDDSKSVDDCLSFFSSTCFSVGETGKPKEHLVGWLGLQCLFVQGYRFVVSTLHNVN